MKYCNGFPSWLTSFTYVPSLRFIHIVECVRIYFLFCIYPILVSFIHPLIADWIFFYLLATVNNTNGKLSYSFGIYLQVELSLRSFVEFIFKTSPDHLNHLVYGTLLRQLEWTEAVGGFCMVGKSFAFSSAWFSPCTAWKDLAQNGNSQLTPGVLMSTRYTAATLLLFYVLSHIILVNFLEESFHLETLKLGDVD